MSLHPETLERPEAEGARAVALALLAEAREQGARVGVPGDVEALHDFRVAVRRLRSTLRAFRDPLSPAVREKDLRRLRRVARATGEARDAEVLLAWLAAAAGDLPAAHRPAADWLSRRLAPRAEASDLAGAVSRLEGAGEVLARRLRRDAPTTAGGSFGLGIAGRIRDHAAAVSGWLARVETLADAPVAHRARIAGKRLRYLLEPLRDTPGVESREAVRSLKRLQDLLGELNDARVAEAAVRAARHDAEAERIRHPERVEGPGLRPGLIALELLASRRAQDLFDRLRAEVLPSRGTDALAPALAVAAALEARAARRTPAPGEARHLLDALPEGAREWPDPVDEEAGWLPDAAGREGFRALRSPAGERFLREVATGSGARRSTVVEPTDPETFDAYWPLTAGRRLHRRRRADPSAGGWRVDEYLDRTLVLAVGPVDADPPAWLGPVHVRDVTGERAYRDEAIARRPARG
ncbi:MAG TPA: CHAD domain-containing protein [Anaeromyxobacteraceae bacterium]|nr:CHAD domain-containing protein [Anaeromyxobacteraceae bacterium]